MRLAAAILAVAVLLCDAGAASSSDGGVVDPLAIPPQTRFGLQPGATMLLHLDPDYRLRVVPHEVTGDRPPGPDEVRATLANTPAGMTLTIVSGSPRTLVYRATLIVPGPGRDRLAPTSSCPLRPSLPVFENWPTSAPLKGLFIGPFRPAPAGEEGMCKVWPDEAGTP